MANRLKMAKVHSIQTLHARGWSQRRIARALGVHRETVARYVCHWALDNRPGMGASKPANGCWFCIRHFALLVQA
jgi:transposase